MRSNLGSAPKPVARFSAERDNLATDIAGGSDDEDTIHSIRSELSRRSKASPHWQKTIVDMLANVTIPSRCAYPEALQPQATATRRRWIRIPV